MGEHGLLLRESAIPLAEALSQHLSAFGRRRLFIERREEALSFRAIVMFEQVFVRRLEFEELNHEAAAHAVLLRGSLQRREATVEQFEQLLVLPRIEHEWSARVRRLALEDREQQQLLLLQVH